MYSKEIRNYRRSVEGYRSR